MSSVIAKKSFINSVNDVLESFPGDSMKKDDYHVILANPLGHYIGKAALCSDHTESLYCVGKVDDVDGCVCAFIRKMFHEKYCALEISGLSDRFPGCSNKLYVKKVPEKYILSGAISESLLI